MLKLIQELRDTSATLDSIVQAQLMKEDIARLEQVRKLAQVSEGYEDFEKEALFKGWTQGDFRTPELYGTLKPFLRAAHDSLIAQGQNADDRVRQCWIAFNQDRTRKLVGCL